MRTIIGRTKPTVKLKYKEYEQKFFFLKTREYKIYLKLLSTFPTARKHNWVCRSRNQHNVSMPGAREHIAHRIATQHSRVGNSAALPISQRDACKHANDDAFT